MDVDFLPPASAGGRKSTGQGNRSVKAGSGQGRAGGLEEGSGCGGIRLGEGPDGENTAEPATDIEAICTLRITLEDLENALPNL